MKFGTKAIHAGVEPEAQTGAVMTPIFQTSTYAQNAPGDHKGYEYSRGENPTREALEASLAALEGATHGIAFSSGLAAEDGILRTLLPGDEVICSHDLYGGSYRLFTKIYSRYGIKFHFVNMSEPERIREVLNEDTKMFWVETPSNPLMQIVDIAAVRKIADEVNGILVVDNTFATPCLQQPLALGADVVMHSITKYLGGHSDVIMGCAMTSNDELAEQIRFFQFACGAVPGPQDCFLALRGIKTLHLRMKAHSENGMAVAKVLKDHPKVETTYYPGLPDHPGHEIAKTQMRDFGGMVSFRLKNNTIEEATAFLQRLKVFTLAESLGGVESLANHPARMTHASIPAPEREKLGIGDGLIRLSVGAEDLEDLVEDVKQALDF